MHNILFHWNSQTYLLLICTQWKFTSRPFKKNAILMRNVKWILDMKSSIQVHFSLLLRLKLIRFCNMEMNTLNESSLQSYNQRVVSTVVQSKRRTHTLILMNACIQIDKYVHCELLAVKCSDNDVLLASKNRHKREETIDN